MNPERQQKGSQPQRDSSPSAPGGPPGRATRLILLVSGTVALSVGVVGAFLPGVPTTPFLLIAAGCYARSSDRLYRWLLRHPRFGPPIRGLLAGQGLPLRVKVGSLGLAYVLLGLTAAFWLQQPWARLLLLALAAIKTYYLLLWLPTAPRSPSGRTGPGRGPSPRTK